MDPVQIPVPTNPIPAPVAPQAPAPVAQEDFFDKFLKWLVSTIGNLINKSTTVASAAVTAVTPTPAPGTPQTFLGGIWETLGNVANTAVNLTGNVANAAVDLTGNVATSAVDLTKTGVSSVVQGAQNVVTPASTPEQAANNVQDFLTQNYQAAETAPVAPVTPDTMPVSAPVIPTTPVQ